MRATSKWHQDINRVLTENGTNAARHRGTRAKQNAKHRWKPLIVQEYNWAIRFQEQRSAGMKGSGKVQRNRVVIITIKQQP